MKGKSNKKRNNMKVRKRKTDEKRTMRREKYSKTSELVASGNHLVRCSY